MPANSKGLVEVSLAGAEAAIILVIGCSKNVVISLRLPLLVQRSILERPSSSVFHGELARRGSLASQLEEPE